jgi:signal transduction histidine kinase
MRRRLDALLPVAVLIGFLSAAIGVNLLLSSAEDRGLDALEDSVTSEVAAVARNQNQRIENSFDGFDELVPRLPRFELVPNSASDLATLELYESAATRSGFYLLDQQGTITQGLLLQGDAIGQRFDWPGYDALVASPAFQRGHGGVLPVSQGYTTDEPVYTFVYPLLEGSAVRGSVVIETVVAPDTNFSKEIVQLGRGDTGRYYFYDSRGTVIAASDAAAIAVRLDDPRLLTASQGFHHFGGDIVALADVPEAGWHVAFRQDAGEFEESLAGPLQTVGRVLIFSLLAGGSILTLLLIRRLRASRAEQERLRVLSEAQQEFISIVSHELRTPVAGVLGFLETSLDHWDLMDDEERRAAVSRAAANARRLQAMTRDVLDTQNVEAGRLVHVFEPLDLGREVQIAVEAALEVDPDRTIDLKLPGDPVRIDGDADRIQQVLANLIDNARKHSPAVEPIQIEVSSRDGMVEVVVADHGAGIADESLERIFEKFVRGRSDTVSGTGLGLYISRQIISAHSGRIWAESPARGGATFRFVLPEVADTADERPDPGGAAREVGPAPKL